MGDARCAELSLTAVSRHHRPPCVAVVVFAWEGGAKDGAFDRRVPWPHMAMTPKELSEFRSRQAKELHERGVFKPRNPGRKPNQPTAHQIVAQRDWPPLGVAIEERTRPKSELAD